MRRLDPFFPYSLLFISPRRVKRTVFLVYAAEKGFLPTCITAGVKIFWKQVETAYGRYSPGNCII